MKNKSVSFFISIYLLSSCASTNFKISKDVYKQEAFSDQYSKDGALIKNVNYLAVNALIPELEKRYGVELEDRKEAHITIITPPEAQGWFYPKRRGLNAVLPTSEMINKFKKQVDNAKFDIVCIGKQTNDKGNIVFYLVVESTDILNIRKEVWNYVSKNGGEKIPFKPVENYFPHITIGFKGGDVHGVSKGSETCIENIKYAKK